MNLVIIDDEPKIRNGIEKLIQDAFHRKHSVYSFGDPLAALAFLADHKADLVITDIRMPGLSGLELIRQLRRSDPGLEIAILSGYSDFTFAQQAIDLKVSKYFTKPSDPEELIAYIEEFEKRQAKGGAASGRYKGSNLAILRCLDFIGRNYANKFNLNEIAEELYITPTYLSKLFKRETGQNLSDYVLEVRMTKARALLSQLEYSIGAIAAMVGYQDTGYFSSAFKNYFGVTPHDFRHHLEPREAGDPASADKSGGP